MVIGAFLALAEEDGKYRPDPTTTTTTTSTIRPYTWNPRWNPSWNVQNPNWNAQNPNWNNNWDRTYRGRWNNNNTGYNWNQQHDWTRNRYDPAYGRDWRTLRLDETADARGYTYVYETVGGIVAEENGVFETVGLRLHDGQRINGQVIITDRDGVTYKINYQVESKEPYVARGHREAERVPPSIARLLALLETHK